MEADFNANNRIKSNLKSVVRVGYLPKSFNELKIENEELHDIVSYGRFAMSVILLLDDRFRYAIEDRHTS